MPSFDLVSEVDLHEVSNAVDQTRREVGTRFDFKGSSAGLEHNDALITLKGDTEFQIQQVRDILLQKLTRRGIDVSALEDGKLVESGSTASLPVTVRQGIDQDMARKLVKLIKGSKLKVQAAIQGDQLRISGKKRDDLQQAIALIRDQDLGLPLQFTNFRD